MNGMNIKAKIALTIGVLVSMIVLLVALSVANLHKVSMRSSTSLFSVST